MTVLKLGVAALCLLMAGAGPVPDAPKDRDEEAVALLDRLKGNIAAIQKISLEYNVFKDEDGGGPRLLLTITQALDDHRIWNRTVHYYDTLVDNRSRPEQDPSLNWLFWENGKRTIFWDHRREAYVDAAPMVKLRVPLIEGYIGHLGLLSPDQCVDDSIDPSVSVWRSKDYYFPEVLGRPGWQIAAREGARGGEVVMLERAFEYGTDRLWLDESLNYAPIRREVLDQKSGPIILLEYRDHESVADHLWLPRTIRTREAGPRPVTRIFQASKLVVNSPDVERFFATQFPPGSAVLDTTIHKQYVVPGGEDLLDRTVERIQFFLDQERTDHRTSGLQWLWTITTSVGIAFALVAVAIGRIARHHRTIHAADAARVPIARSVDPESPESV